MNTRRQLTVLRAVAGIAVLLFAFQPKVDAVGEPCGYHLFTTDRVFTGPYEFRAVWPDYRLLAAEFAVLVIVAVCLYLAARPVQG